MNIAKLLLVAGALSLGGHIATAQSVPVVNKLPKLDLGIKIGGNFAQLGGNGWEQTYKPGITSGAFIGLHKHKIGLQAEVLLNTSHYTTKGLVDSVNKGDFRALYLDIPVLFEYKLIGAKLAPKVWLQAGPQFSTLMSVKNLNDYKGDAKSAFKSSTASLVLGAEMRYLKFVLGARYIIGLTDVNNTGSVNGLVSYGTDKWNNKSYQLYIGFKFI